MIFNQRKKSFSEVQNVPKARQKKSAQTDFFFDWELNFKPNVQSLIYRCELKYLIIVLTRKTKQKHDVK